ncbi:hypothetical protein JCM5353_006402 [Sporobolomyces roseus]
MGKKSNAARFPLARIKKMIQADEDVGKVAQATPIVVSKALELFLASLVQASVKDAEARGSKKLTPYGLKRAINTTPTLDFCTDIVEGVADPIEGEEDGLGASKKRKAAKGKGSTVSKKQKGTKAKADDDFLDDDDDEGEEEEDEEARDSKPKNTGSDEDYEE